MPFDGLQLGHYRLLRLIGSGGMGEVYLAEDPRINQQVAIKVIQTGPTAYADERRAQEAIRYFLREARAVATLNHPNILPLFAFDEVALDETVLTYLIMPFFPEGSLANWIRLYYGQSLLAPQSVVEIILQAAGALQHAHDHYIIHQDVKPSNFLARSNTKHPAYPDVFLADFGVAKFSSATSSMSQTVRGTPTYMGPEQWMGQPVPASDQYALAIMVYELLAGWPPFYGPPMRVMYLHAQAQPPPASAINPRLSSALDDVLQVALAKGPQERFPSISAFADALQQAVQSTDSTILSRTSNSDSTFLVKKPLADIPAPVKTPQLPISSGDVVGDPNVSTPAPDTGNTGRPPPSTFGRDDTTYIKGDSDATIRPSPASVPTTPDNAYQHATPPPQLHSRRTVLVGLAAVAALMGGGGIAYALFQSHAPTVPNPTVTPPTPTPIITTTTTLPPTTTTTTPPTTT
ncbi:MAG: serine/threonine protein kinase, partial [Chloroflexi bacterium]